MLKIDAEFKNLIPPLSKEEYEQLEKNILAEGIREPILLWDVTQYQCCNNQLWKDIDDRVCVNCGKEFERIEYIIDGHNRYEIATKHNLEYKTAYKHFDNRESVIEWIILNQFGRRNLSAYDRSRLALKLKPVFEEKAKENILATQNNNSSSAFQKSGKQIHTSKELAKVAGVSHDTIAKVQKIEEKAPEIIKEKVKSGDISINQAYQQVRKQEKLKKVEEKIIVNKEKSTGFVDIYNTDKKYSIIYADPPWSYSDWENGLRNPTTHYKTMTLSDIYNLPIMNIADENCILFLWVTYPLLQDSFKVIESWGFKYKTAGFVWVKKNKTGQGNFFGCGNYTRANSELCLIATKGKIERLDASISQIIESSIEEHSKKPDVTRELIVKLVGELSRIELFSRQYVNGWDCWGNEI